MEITRIFDILESLVAKYPKDDILARKSHGKWIKISSEEYRRYSHFVAYALLAEGFKPQDKIITLSNNRPEWNFVDMGATLAGMIHVPVYSTLSHDEFVHIFNHSDCSAIFIGSDSLLKKILPILAEVKRDIKIYTFEPIDGYKSISDLYEIAKESEPLFAETIKNNKKTIDKHDVATIIYTSGTTGIPKGVMLSHDNLIFNAKGHAAMQIRDHTHKMLSFLPLSHIYERSMNYEYQILGVSTYYAEGLGTIAADLADCRADGFCSVPRVLEMVFAKFEATGKTLKGIQAIIYKWAFDMACEYDYTKKGALYSLKHSIADKLVYKKWRDALGGKEMLVVSGGSSIQAKIIRLFTAAKMYIFEGYGMTETSPVIAVNNPKEMIIKIGTVGKIFPGTELIIAEDGEILTRGPHIMKGYYKDPENTKEIIDSDGWLHTGDIGVLIDGGFLKITDRKKEIFKLSAGKYIAPQVIENLLRELQSVENCMVIGENQKFASAIIVPAFAYLRGWAKEKGLSYDSDEELIKLKEVISLISSDVDIVNKQLSPHEHIKRARLVSEEWSPSNDLLSQTLKLKRINIRSKYKAIIDEIFNID